MYNKEFQYDCINKCKIIPVLIVVSLLACGTDFRFLSFWILGFSVLNLDLERLVTALKLLNKHFYEIVLWGRSWALVNSLKA